MFILKYFKWELGAAVDSLGLLAKQGIARMAYYVTVVLNVIYRSNWNYVSNNNSLCILNNLSFV